MRLSPLAVNGPLIRALREARGWDLNAFAALVEASPSFMSRVENGHRQPNLALRFRIAKTLGVKLAAITKEPVPAQVAEILDDAA